MSRSTGSAAAYVLLALWVALAGCGSQQTVEEMEFRIPVTAREVGTGVVEDLVVATGSLRPVEVASIRAETTGTLRYARDARGRRPAEGDRVRAGRLIAEITGEDVRLAARTEATQRRYDVARRDYESKLKLFEAGLMSELEFRPVETELTEARLALEQSRLTETRSKLVAPIDGVLLELARDETRRPLADGQLVSQGLVVAQIAPVDTLVADVDLVGPDVVRVAPGLPARVRHHARDDRTFEGTVVRLAPALDAATRTLRAEVEVDNREGLLRPGMFVEVSVVIERREDVPVVPRDAVVERGGSRVVFVVNGQRVAEREVVLGLGDDDVIEVRDGVEPGERLVVRGLETLQDNQRVRVQ